MSRKPKMKIPFLTKSQHLLMSLLVGMTEKKKLLENFKSYMNIITITYHEQHIGVPPLT
jgi:hypothetical protein